MTQLTPNLVEARVYKGPDADLEITLRFTDDDSGERGSCTGIVIQFAQALAEWRHQSESSYPDSMRLRELLDTMCRLRERALNETVNSLLSDDDIAVQMPDGSFLLLLPEERKGISSRSEGAHCVAVTVFEPGSLLAEPGKLIGFVS